MENRNYLYAILRTDGSQEAEEHNNYWLGPKTLGVEVTQYSLAQRCGLGNLDPQHGGDGKSSAIEQALTCELPPNNAKLVTLRKDKDALGAMAVLMERAAGNGQKIDTWFVHWLGALDRMPFREAREKYPELAEQFSATPSDAMNFIIHNEEWALPRKVLLVAQILTGEMPWGDIEEMAKQMKRAQHKPFPAEMFGSIAHIFAPGEYNQAREYGNKRYPVAVIFDPERITESGGVQARWCIIRQVKPDKVFDRIGCEAAINAAEANARGLTLEELRKQNFEWGGPPNMLVSPQGARYGTKLPKEEIIAIARQHYESGIVT